MLTAHARRVSFAVACFSCLTTACAITPSTSGTNEATAVGATMSPCKTAQRGNILGQQMANVVMNETSSCITAIFEVDESGRKVRIIAENIELAPMGRAYFTSDLGTFGVELTDAAGVKIEVNSLGNGLVDNQGVPARGRVYNGEDPYANNRVLANRPWTMIRTMSADLSAPTQDAVSAANTFFVAGAGGGGGGGSNGRAQAVLADGSRVTQNVGPSGYPQAQAPQQQQGQQQQKDDYAQDDYVSDDYSSDGLAYSEDYGAF